MTSDDTKAPGFVGHDKRGRFLHFCHCGNWGAYGYHVKLLAGQLGEWYCAEHRPRVEVFVAEPGAAAGG